MDSSYMFELDYGNRVSEKRFIRDILKEFDRNKITGATLIINNNPYSLEFYFYINFSGDSNALETWMKSNYPSYINKKRKYNYFLGDVFTSMGERGYQVLSIDDFMIDMLITKESNEMSFLWPDREIMFSQWKGGLKEKKTQAFLCHNSKDKDKIDNIFNALQKNGVNVFYDKHGIKAGENIRDVINENLYISDTGILCVSENFDQEKSKWIQDEVEYFKSKNVKIIPINIGLSDKEMKRKVGDIRYLDYNDESYMNELIKIVG